MAINARRACPWILALPALLFTMEARADDASTPCGRFDFSGGLSCRVEVSGGCTADCTSLKLEAACSGGCSATADTTCVNDCGTQCVAMCDPQLLDCFAGCHSECDQPTMQDCQTKHAGEDCLTAARSQCDIHCKDACQVPPSNCQEHCTKCCTGSCTTQVNFDCDFSCFADVRGGCEVQCQKPEGAIFCNGQYVHASDVQACIAYLATQGIDVDVSARGSVKCDLNGCSGVGDIAGTGCAAAPQSRLGGGAAAGALLLFGMTAVAARARRRRR